MTTDIDAIIAEATIVPAAPAQTTETPATESQPEDGQQQEAAETKPDGDAKEGDKPEREPFPDKAVKALGRKDRQIGKWRARAADAQSEVKRLRAELDALKGSADTEYETPEQHVKAISDRNYVERRLQEVEQQSEAAIKALEAERAAAIDENAAAAAKAFPDFFKVMDDNAAALRGMPEHIRDALLEAENGAYALYHALKEGQLTDLYSMPPVKAAMAIARLEDRAISSVPKPKTVSSAPAPLAAAKGTAPGGKSLDRMTADELMEWLKSPS